MISTKRDLGAYLDAERSKYLFGGRKDTLIAYITDDPRARIWKYQKRLRICEYRYNNRHRSPWHFLMFLWARRRKNRSGRKLGIEISENVFGKGLAIYHYGNIVVNGDSSVGENCILHGDNCIGNSGKPDDFAAPRLGDGVDIGAGASIVGSISIANGTRIGAGAVVTKSVEDPNTIVAGIPARPLHRKKTDSTQATSEQQI